MSAPDKPDLARGMRHAMRLAADQSDRLAKADDAEIQQAMEAIPPPSRVPSVDELLSGAKQKARDRGHLPAGLVDEPSAAAPAPSPAPVIALPARRARRGTWIPWLVAAALGAVAVTLVAERREVMAWLHGPEAPPIGPTHDEMRGPTPQEIARANQEKAEAFRSEADKECESWRWEDCAFSLERARMLDPAGEDTPRVKELRDTIQRHSSNDSKGAPAPKRR